MPGVRGAVTLAAHLAGRKVQFMGAYALLAGLVVLFMFVPPLGWQYLEDLASGAFVGCLLGGLVASGRVRHLPDR